MSDFWQDLRRQIPFISEGGAAFLNSGWASPVPRPVASAVAEYFALQDRHGPVSPETIAALDKTAADVRARAARLLGAGEDEIALTQNTTHGLALAINALKWRPGDELIVPRPEYPTGPWNAELAARRYGLKVVVVDPAPENPDVAAEEIIAAFTDRTRLVALSHVNFHSGTRVAVEKVCGEARARGVLSLLDGAQTAGVIPLDVGKLGCDFYAVPAQKWLLGVEGAGALFVRRDLAPGLLPLEAGYLGVEPGPGGLAFRPDARRFEYASPSHASLAAFRAGLELVLEAGIERVAARVEALTGRLKAGLKEKAGTRLITPEPFARSAGLVAFSREGEEAPARTVARLAEEHRVFIREVPQGPWLRASVHAFNDDSDLDRLLAAL